MSAAFTCSNLGKSFVSRSGLMVEALKAVELTAVAGKITSVVGPTGSGKSTLLRLMAGLEVPDTGELSVGGTQPGGLAPGAIGYLTQQHALLPWLNVLDNIALPLEINGWSRGKRTEKASAIAASLGLGGREEIYPYELSGGMQRRTALGRLLAQEAAYWLLDEPFSTLDERTRHELQELLISLVADNGLSVLFITHSVDEAVWLSDRVEVLSASPGRVVESFSPEIERPRDRMSAGYGEAMERIRKSLERVLG